VAFDNRSFGSRVEYVSLFDPALDTESDAFDWDAYLKTFDRKHAPSKDGGTADLAVFTLAPLSRPQYLHVRRQDDGMTRAFEALAYGLKGIKGFKTDGRDLTIGQAEMRKCPNGRGERLVERMLDSLMNEQLVVELAAVILSITNLRPTNG
jgi:hypothetical protein